MATFKQQTAKKPPITQISIVRWLKNNLFSSVFSSVLTVFSLYLLYLIIPPLLNWMVLDADFTAMSNDKCTREAACWSYIAEKINLYWYGFYPPDEYWRVHMVLALAVLFVGIARFYKQHTQRFKIILTMLLTYPLMAFVLLYGGFGLVVVETSRWGGLMLTIVIAVVGIAASLPIGILMALGRQSKMQIVRFFCVIYIEIIRGVPLITILFMASVMLPLFFAQGVDVDKLLRALIGISLFQSAYFAEIIRGGLQAIPKGQYEAADAIGLNFIQKTSLIILPQALKISIPNIAGSSISLFKDTTLVLIIGLFDILAIVGLSSSDENWLGRETEGYVFITLVMWIMLYSMSQYSKSLERRFNVGHLIKT